MLDLTSKQLEAALWCIHTVDLGYGTHPPDGTVIAALRRDLLDDLHRKQHNTPPRSNPHAAEAVP